MFMELNYAIHLQTQVTQGQRPVCPCCDLVFETGEHQVVLFRNLNSGRSIHRHWVAVHPRCLKELAEKIDQELVLAALSGG